MRRPKAIIVLAIIGIPVALFAVFNRTFDHRIRSHRVLASMAVEQYTRHQGGTVEEGVKVWRPLIEEFVMGVSTCGADGGCEYVLLHENKTYYKLNHYGKIIESGSVRE